MFIYSINEYNLIFNQIDYRKTFFCSKIINDYINFVFVVNNKILLPCQNSSAKFKNEFVKTREFFKFQLSKLNVGRLRIFENIYSISLVFLQIFLIEEVAK